MPLACENPVHLKLPDQSHVVLYGLRVEGDMGRHLFDDRDLEPLLGYCPNKTLNPEWWQDALHSEDRPRVLAGLREGISSAGFRLIYRLRHADGGYVWVEDHCRVIRNASGEVLAACGFWLEITARKQGVA